MAFDPPPTTYVRGIGLNSAMDFAERELGLEPVQERLRSLESQHGDYRSHRLSSSSVPLGAAAAAWQAVAELHGGERAQLREFFQRVGVHIADTNLNGVYKAMMSLLINPERLAKRIPVLWKSYFRGLTHTVDLDHLSEGMVRTTVEGFGGAPYIGEMAEGWVAYAFRLVGGEEVVAHEAALNTGAPNPGPIMDFTIRWRVG